MEAYWVTVDGGRQGSVVSRSSLEELLKELHSIKAQLDQPFEVESSNFPAKGSTVSRHLLGGHSTRKQMQRRSKLTRKQSTPID